MLTASEKISSLINEFIKRFSLQELEFFGPSPAMIEKRTNLYTWYFMLKCTNPNPLHQTLSMLDEHRKMLSPVEMKLDIDPYMCL